MISVDEHQFQLGYAPIACGLQMVVFGCALASVIAAIWFFIFR